VRQNQAHLPPQPPTAGGAGARQGAARGGAGPRRRSHGGSAPRSRGGSARSGQRPAASTRGAGGAGNQRSAIDLALEAALAEPAPAATTFRQLGLPAPLVAALAERGIEAPFAIQARALPDALAGRDVLGRAQTGSGKTLAFGLPTLVRLAGAPGARLPKAPRGLVLVPTRELAQQVADVLVPLGAPLGVSVTTVYGGASLVRQIERLRRGVDIVVATPGRLIDLLDRGACTLGQIEVTVLDEADHMADLGFLPAVTRILDQTPPTGQRMLFSATLDRDVDRLVTNYLTTPALHAVAPLADAAAAEHQVFILPAAGKVAVAAEIASRPARTLFFVRTKHGAARLARQLTQAGTPATAIHGNLNQNQRQRALDAFSAGRPRVLVATDVAARGLHIDDVELVVHFDPPNDHKDYLHRSGRTARAGASGTVLALVDPAQAQDVARLHSAAGIAPTSHHVEAGHPAVREIATSGTPIPPSAPAPARPPSQERGPRTKRPPRAVRTSGERRPSRDARQSGGERPGRPGSSGSPGRPLSARPADIQRGAARSWADAPAVGRNRTDRATGASAQNQAGGSRAGGSRAGSSRAGGSWADGSRPAGRRAGRA
jgi:superfamily II DNA/RNA helicase